MYNAMCTPMMHMLQNLTLLLMLLYHGLSVSLPLIRTPLTPTLFY